MPRREFVLSGYRGMWIFAMFDLPVKTKTQRKKSSQFRNLLLKQGFSMLQYSVYARYCPSEESAKTLRGRLCQKLPSPGHVRLLMVTDRQFGKMDVFYGKKKTKAESPPSQLTLF
ncbi:MAG: CRISPR-associated endonuclease Cas2 [Planctomycetaceae bacterium]|nr:CRISPR-associated endonuclease Cas2 [Planctomycetaceae bacterium]